MFPRSSQNIHATQGGGLSVTSGIVGVPSEYLTMTAADDVSTVTYRTIRVDTPIN